MSNMSYLMPIESYRIVHYPIIFEQHGSSNKYDYRQNAYCNHLLDLFSKVNQIKQVNTDVSIQNHLIDNWLSQTKVN